MTTNTPDSQDLTSGVAPSHRASGDDAVHEAVLIEEPAAAPVADEIVIDTDGASAVPPQQIVYVQSPTAPRAVGNRGVGALIAALSALVFSALLALVVAGLQYARTGLFDVSFLSQTQFYIPMLFFVLAFVLLVLLVNRGAWWAYIIGSVFVGLAVYFGTTGLGLLTTGIISNTPAEANARFIAQLANPFVIASALLAREVSLWFGALISRRGRSLKARNAAARETFQRERAEHRAQG